MINIQNEVFDRLTKTLKAFDAKVKTSSVYTNSPTSYPFVSIEEIDNSTYELGSDSCNIENYADISFEINIYTKGDKRKSECYKLLEVANDFMQSIGFIRNSVMQMQDQNDTLYRIIGRYSGVVGKDHKVYRR